MKKFYYIYIIASSSDVLYVGITNNLIRRMNEHRNCIIEGFSKKYHCHRLVFYEYTEYVNDALLREKTIKSWSRKKKVELIESMNPCWKDLYDEIIL